MAEFQTFPSGKSLLDMDDVELLNDRIIQFGLDADWREKWVDFKRAAELYEKTSNDDTETHTSSDETRETVLPFVNMIRRAVEDYISVATANTPDARLIAERFINDQAIMSNKQLMMLMEEVIEDAEQNINEFAESILIDNDYEDEKEATVRQAAIYGVGYIQTTLDQSADTRFSPELRDLFEKPMERWSDQDRMRYKALINRIDVSRRDSRDVFWQHGMRVFDEKMLRVSVIEKFDTRSLQVIYDNTDIFPGQFPYFVNEADKDSSQEITARLTTWELVPVVKSKVVVTPDGMPQSMEMTDWVLVETVIAGGQLVGREHINEDFRGSTRLPIIPFYLRESEEHPYGYSLPLALETSQNFINAVRMLIYQSALNAISPQALVGAVPNMAAGDEERIKTILQEGGFANVVGNDYQGRVNIQEMVQQVQRHNPGVSVALIQAMQNEERAFQGQAQTIDLAQIARAESGSAKRAQIAVSDRPKTITLNLLSKSQEAVLDNIYDIIRHTYIGQTPVSVVNANGIRRSVTLNEPFQEQVPQVVDGEVVTDKRGEPVYENFSAVLNDTNIRMKAQAEGRGNMPPDLPSRLVFVSQLDDRGLFKSRETLRELLMDRALRAKDERNFKEDAQRMQNQQAQGVAGAVGDPAMLAELSGQPINGDQNAQTGGESVGATDIVNDQQAQTRDNEAQSQQFQSNARTTG